MVHIQVQPEHTYVLHRLAYKGKNVLVHMQVNFDEIIDEDSLTLVLFPRHQMNILGLHTLMGHCKNSNNH